MLVDVVTRVRRRGRPARPPPRPTRPAPRPTTLLKASLEIGLPILGVPEALGGISEERSAMAGTLVAEALAKGDMGLAVATLAPGSVATALGALGHRRAAADLPAGVHRRRRPGRRARARPSRPSCSTCSRPPTTATRTGDGYVLNGVKSLVAARRRGRAVRRRRRARRQARRCSSSSPSTDGLERRGRPRDGRPGRLARPRLTLDGRHASPADAVLGDDRRHDVRRVRAALPARLVRARRRHRPGGARLRDAVRQGARRRSASRSRTASRWRSWSPTSRSSCRRCGC